MDGDGDEAARERRLDAGMDAPVPKVRRLDSTDDELMEIDTPGLAIQNGDDRAEELARIFKEITHFLIVVEDARSETRDQIKVIESLSPLAFRRFHRSLDVDTKTRIFNCLAKCMRRSITCTPLATACVILLKKLVPEIGWDNKDLLETSVEALVGLTREALNSSPCLYESISSELLARIREAFNVCVDPRTWRKSAYDPHLHIERLLDNDTSTALPIDVLAASSWGNLVFHSRIPQVPEGLQHWDYRVRLVYLLIAKELVEGLPRMLYYDEFLVQKELGRILDFDVHEFRRLAQDVRVEILLLHLFTRIVRNERMEKEQLTSVVPRWHKILLVELNRFKATGFSPSLSVALTCVSKALESFGGASVADLRNMHPTLESIASLVDDREAPVAFSIWKPKPKHAASLLDETPCVLIAAKAANIVFAAVAHSGVVVRDLNIPNWAVKTMRKIKPTDNLKICTEAVRCLFFCFSYMARLCYVVGDLARHLISVVNQSLTFWTPDDEVLEHVVAVIDTVSSFPSIDPKNRSSCLSWITRIWLNDMEFIKKIVPCLADFVKQRVSKPGFFDSDVFKALKQVCCRIGAAVTDGEKLNSLLVSLLPDLATAPDQVLDHASPAHLVAVLASPKGVVLDCVCKLVPSISSALMRHSKPSCRQICAFIGNHLLETLDWSEKFDRDSLKDHMHKYMQFHSVAFRIIQENDPDVRCLLNQIYRTVLKRSPKGELPQADGVLRWTQVLEMEKCVFDEMGNHRPLVEALKTVKEAVAFFQLKRAEVILFVNSLDGIIGVLDFALQKAENKSLAKESCVALVMAFVEFSQVVFSRHGDLVASTAETCERVPRILQLLARALVGIQPRDSSAGFTDKELDLWSWLQDAWKDAVRCAKRLVGDQVVIQNILPDALDCVIQKARAPVRFEGLKNNPPTNLDELKFAHFVIGNQLHIWESLDSKRSAILEVKNFYLPEMGELIRPHLPRLVETMVEIVRENFPLCPHLDVDRVDWRFSVDYAADVLLRAVGEIIRTNSDHDPDVLLRVAENAIASIMSILAAPWTNGCCAIKLCRVLERMLSSTLGIPELKNLREGVLQVVTNGLDWVLDRCSRMDTDEIDKDRIGVLADLLKYVPRPEPDVIQETAKLLYDRVDELLRTSHNEVAWILALKIVDRRLEWDSPGNGEEKTSQLLNRLFSTWEGHTVKHVRSLDGGFVDVVKKLISELPVVGEPREQYVGRLMECINQRMDRGAEIHVDALEA